MDIKDYTDEALMSLYQAGNEDAFNILYGRYKGRIYSYLIKRLNNVATVSDVYQNIFVKMHKSRDLYNPKYLFSQWIFTIVTSTLIDTYRSIGRNKTEELSDNLASVSSDSEPVDIKSELSKLSEADSDIIKLRYYEDKSFMEIAELLNMSELNVRQKISRAIRKLRKFFNRRSV